MSYQTQMAEAAPELIELEKKLAAMTANEVRFNKKAIAADYADNGLTASDIVNMKKEVDSRLKAEAAAAEDSRASGESLELWFEDEEPSLEPQQIDAVLTDLYALLRKPVCYKSPEQTSACALWVLATWFVDQLDYAPYLLITAPMKACGKSTLLNTLSRLVRKPFPTSSTSAAGVFRVMSEYHPTLMIDEADTFLAQDQSLTGMLNAGIQRGTPAVRVEKNGAGEFVPMAYDSFGFKAICGINARRLSETITDRSIVIELQRRQKGQTITRLRDIPEERFQELRSRMARLAEDYGEKVKSMRPQLPEKLSDRAGDKWFGLLAIAEASGNSKLLRAYEKCAVELSKTVTESSISELLDSLGEILPSLSGNYVLSQALLDRLLNDPDGGWDTYFHGKPITKKWLGRKLHDFGVKSFNVRIEGNAKGYRISEIQAVLDRYREEQPEDSTADKEPLVKPDPMPWEQPAAPLAERSEALQGQPVEPLEAPRQPEAEEPTEAALEALSRASEADYSSPASHVEDEDIPY